MESKKRVQLMLNIQNNTIINKIMRGLKTMINKMINKIKNIIKTWLDIDLISNRVDSHYDQLNDKCESLEKLFDDYEYELDNKINTILTMLDELDKLVIFESKKNVKQIKALELALTMAKNDHENLQNAFNKYVLRPKAQEALTKPCNDKEDYSFESELEQQQKDNK